MTPAVACTGIRATDRYNPEEINRRVSDVLSEIIFCCTKTDVENLESEGYEPHRIEAASAAPGFVLAVNSDGMTIATKAGAVRCARARATGEKASAETVATAIGIAAGSLLG